MVKLLVAGPTTKISQLASYAEQAGHRVIRTIDGSQALEMFGEFSPDIGIIAEGLPLISGREVCAAIRHQSSVPLILLVGELVLAGSLVGKHRYSLCLPLAWEIDELLRHSLEFLKASKHNLQLNDADTASSIKSGRMTHDEILSHTARSAMTPKEAKLFEYFQENANKPLSRKEILLHVWGYDYLGDTRTIDVHVRNLRKRFSQNTDFCIRTIRNVGYILDVPCRAKSKNI